MIKKHGICKHSIAQLTLGGYRIIQTMQHKGAQCAAQELHFRLEFVAGRFGSDLHATGRVRINDDAHLFGK